MLGKAAMIAVLLAPTASIARHADHSTDANPVRCFNVAASSPRHRADETRPRPPPALRFLRLLLHPTRSDALRSGGCNPRRGAPGPKLTYTVHDRSGDQQVRTRQIKTAHCLSWHSG